MADIKKKEKMGGERLNQLTCRMGSGVPVSWTDTDAVIRWDFASTGSVANLTPIFGYLWLMAKARIQFEKFKKFDVVVPKISSKGASCGTVDILEAGGLIFPSDPNEITRRCMEKGGVLCQQNDMLTPIDKALMKRRKVTNTMKSAAWVYASVIGKKIALGCTHVVVDVKVGGDTKMFAPWMDNKMAQAFWDASGKPLVLHKSDDLNELAALLEKLGQKVKVAKSGGWVVQTCDASLTPLTEIRWFMTNADQPQCRAIGRELILLHLDRLLGEDGSDGLLEVKDYKKLYCDIIPALCDIKTPSIKQIKTEWMVLRKQLPKMDRLVVKNYLDDRIGQVNNPRAAHKLLKEESEPIEDVPDLAAITVGLKYYQHFEGEVVIKSINAYWLDRFFEELCGDNEYDTEVGVWLYKLPGEVTSNVEPFISVFFRPSLTTEHELLSKIRHFLTNEVGVAKSE